jgi:hypothetical protein
VTVPAKTRSRVSWPAVTVAVALLLVVALSGRYLAARQRVADGRAEKQRRAICAILANIPGEVPAEIRTARRAFARDGHPGDCEPIRRSHGKPRPTPTVTATVAPRPGPTRTVTPAPVPAVTVTRTATPRPTATPSTRPTPTPTPSRTCVLFVCTTTR